MVGMMKIVQDFLSFDLKRLNPAKPVPRRRAAVGRRVTSGARAQVPGLSEFKLITQLASGPNIIVWLAAS